MNRIETKTHTHAHVIRDGPKRTRRRESAPLQLFAKQKPTSEEKLRNSLIRFTQFREHQRIQRLSMGANDAAAYHTISGETPNISDANTTPTEQNRIVYQPETCPPKPCRSHDILEKRDENTQPSHHNGRRTKKVSVQFHFGESTDDSDMNVGHRKSRHSMPAIVTNAYVRGRKQNSIDSTIIQEEAIEEFEEEHCMYNSDTNSVNDDQSSYRSPPMKFYRQNLSPYSETSSMSTLAEALPIRGCPEKPKRLLLNSKQSRKLLTEAHFTGEYRNFEIKSPYYSDSSSMISGVMAKQSHTINENDLNGDITSQLDHYQVIVNKHGDEVEYALPCIDLPQYQRRQQLSDCLKSDDSTLADEVFDKDAKEFSRILGEMASNTSISLHEEHTHVEHQTNGKVMITDLDKSMESAHTLDDTLSRAEQNDETNFRQMRQSNRVLQFHETMQCADIICLISEFNSMGKMENKIKTPLLFEWGTFKTANVTVRKYDDSSNDEPNEDFTLVAETAIIRDAEVLR